MLPVDGIARAALHRSAAQRRFLLKLKVHGWAARGERMVRQSFITITQQSSSSEALWRINDGPKDYVGHRGGNLIIDVAPTDASIKNVQWGQ